MRTALMVLALLAAPAFASQAVWKWVDEKGVTHYTDRPVPGAQRVEINVGSPADSPPPSSAARSNQPNPQQDRETVADYVEFAISKPAEQETVANTGGVVNVSLQIAPMLHAGHTVRLLLNGKPVEGFPADGSDFTMRDVPRGEHTFVGVIQDGDGKRVQETRPVRFFVRQQSIANPPAGPALRTTPPRPRGQTANKPLTRQPSYAALNGQRVKIDPATNKPVK